MSIYRGKNKNEIYLASLLYDAIEDSDFRSVKTLICEKGADPNLVLPKHKIAPFHLIIGNDSEKFALDVTVLILQNGGNPNVQSDDGLTPIHIAAAWGRYELLKVLLDCGGDPEIRDTNKKTALDYALEENFNNCYNLLKLYLVDKFSLMNREKEDCIKYTINLDKILVNNGTTLGEYEIVNEYKSVCKMEEKLCDLPQANNREFMLNWFNTLEQVSQTSKNTSGSVTGLSDDSGDSLKESDEERRSKVDADKICFRKVYRKKMKTPKSKNSSRESGIVTLSDDLPMLNLELAKDKNASSDYVTCTSGDSPDLLERNIFDFTGLMTNDSSCNKSQISVVTKSEGISSSDLSFVSVSEIYKYVDEEEGIVLFERRFLKTPVSDCGDSVRSFVSSLPAEDPEDIDPETIRKELTLLGYNPGPITSTTKVVYLKKLKQLRKLPPIVVSSSRENGKVRVYSNELEKTLLNPDWSKDLLIYKQLDEAVQRQFSSPNPARKWREGTNKTSFTYLLLDPRLSNNLPIRAESMKPNEIWETFLSAIFYVGKGKRSRPYSHLYEAVNLWNSGQSSAQCEKLTKILDIWRDNCGVVCLHLFQNTIPVEAYTREAAIIHALKVENLCNVKRGDFYGEAATWTPKQKNMLGVYLLHKALVIFLNEGERQLCPSDIN